MSVTSVSEFWSIILKYYGTDMRRMKPGECIGPFSMNSILSRLGIRISGTPRYISISKVSDLPSILRKHGLYPIRLGQWRDKYGSFIACKAHGDYDDETLGAPYGYAGLKTGLLGRDVASLLKKLRGEAVASTLGINYILRKARGAPGDNYIIPQYRLGNTSFCFLIGGRKYQYRGQVEIDSVVITGSGDVYVLEAKNILIRDRVFKFQLAFSAQSMAEATRRKVYGIYAIRIRNSNTVYILKAGEARPNSCIDINNITYTDMFCYQLE